MTKLKTLHGCVDNALAKADLLRLHGEPDVAESICRDVLAVSPEHQGALVRLVLCLTDQFRDGAKLETTRDVAAQLHDEYERWYYLGVIYERWARSLYRRGNPDAVALEWYVEAMRSFDKAQALAAPDNEDAVMRWNACLRRIRADEALRQKFGALWAGT